jgi:hypothetical protein
MAEISIKRHPFYKNYGISDDLEVYRIEPFLKISISNNASGYKFFNLSNNKNQYAIGLDTFVRDINGTDTETTRTARTARTARTTETTRTARTTQTTMTRDKRKFLIEGHSYTVTEYAFLTGSRIGSVKDCLRDPLGSLYDIRKNHFISLIKTRGGYLENLLEHLRDPEGQWVEFERTF